MTNLREIWQRYGVNYLIDHTEAYRCKDEACGERWCCVDLEDDATTCPYCGGPVEIDEDYDGGEP